MKTGIHLKPCNVGNAEAHKRRDRSYCEAVEKKYGHTYFWDEFRHLNVNWRNTSYDKPLPEVMEDLKMLVKEKTGRSMQCKPVVTTDRKTGKKKERSGCSAIREGCPPIKPDTKIEDFAKFIEWIESKGCTVISIDLHHDEGHADPEPDDLKPNHHAHVIVEWINRETGKSVKLNKEDCSMMQTVLAESLGMERGTPKQDTGVESLSAIEYKEKMAKEHVRKLQEEIQDSKEKYREINDEIKLKKDSLNILDNRKREQSKLLEMLAKEEEQIQEELKDLDREAEEKKERNANLDKEHEERQKAFEEENNRATKSGIANLFGKGKYAEIEKENKRLLAENEEMKTQVAEMEDKVAMIPSVVEKKVVEKIGEINKLHEQEKKQLKIDFDGEYDNLVEKHNGVVGKYNELLQNFRALKANSEYDFKKLKQEYQTLKDRIDKFLESFSEIVRKAIKAVISFAKSKMYTEFSRDHKEAVVKCLNAYTVPEDMAHNLKVFTVPFLTDREHEKGSKELDRTVKNLPALTAELEHTQSRGFRR